MNTVLAVKTNFAGDIRRFSVSSATPYHLIEESIGRFYNLNLGTFRISLLDTEGNINTLDRVLFAKLFAEHASNPKRTIVRLHIQRVFSEKEELAETEAVPEKQEDSLTPSPLPQNTSRTVQTESIENDSSEFDWVSLLDNPQFEEKLRYLMTEAMASRSLMDFVKEGFVPSMIRQMR